MTDEIQAEENLRIVLTRRGAERMRRRVVAMAGEYAVLARRHRLDPEIVADDVAAVVKAWQGVPQEAKTAQGV